MKRKLKEWISVQSVKNPGKVVLATILLFNIVVLLAGAFIISSLSLSGTEKMGFLEAAFCTITMILDAGCISFVVEDIGQSGVFTVVICLTIIIIGMVSFTGAVIGYVTNYISGFIENANAGSKKLHMSDHFVILNWNTRASEIINDLLYCETKQKVVVLVGSKREEVKQEIDERLTDTIVRENAALRERCADMNFFKKYCTIIRNHFKKNVTVIVKEGDVFSSKQLRDIALERAATVVILGNDINNTVCKFEHKEVTDQRARGNSQTVKTLMQVADITAAATSADDQKIIVEITDDWTWDLVDKIIRYKQVEGKCNIVPVRVNKILGQILSQFSLMPELNFAYQELFSNKGATFFSPLSKRRVALDEPFDRDKVLEEDHKLITEYLRTHRHAIPLTHMIEKKLDDEKDADGKRKFKNVYNYFSAAREDDIKKLSAPFESDYTVNVNKHYKMEKKNVIILGHNSKCRDIMHGFGAFCEEWRDKNSNEDVLQITVIDDQKSLDKLKDYESELKDYAFSINPIAASIYDRDKICDEIDKIVSANKEDTSVLILSDDEALNEDIDANALANLVYVQDIINKKVKDIPNFDVESIDIIVEIIDPKHYDIVNSYSVNNVVISNRYISKMITQIGEKEALYNFYADILTYDEAA